MLLLAIMETDVRAIRIKPARKDLLLCDQGEWEAGRGKGVRVEGAESKNSASGSHSGSFWHHLSGTLIGPEACLEHGQGQALSCKSCRAQCLFKVGHVEHISVILASPSFPPLDLCCGRSSCPGSRGSRLLWSMACGRASLTEETRQAKSSPDAVRLTWQGSLALQTDGSKICETQLSLESLHYLQKPQEKGRRGFLREGLHKAQMSLESERRPALQLGCRRVPSEGTSGGDFTIPVS